MMLSPARATVLVLALFVTGVTAGAAAGTAAASRARDPYAGLDLFARVLTVVENDYVEERQSQELVEAAIRGMIDELDPHSRWLSPEENRRLKQDTQGSYEGIGVKVETEPRGVEVVEVIPESPAERDGLKTGDVLVAIDGESIAGVEVGDVVRLLQGERGAPVVLTVVRVGWDTPRDVRTVRDRIKLELVRAEAFGTGMGYARLVQFHDNAAKDLQAKVRGLYGGDAPRGLILDLRDNPGGLLDEAVAVADLFLDEGPIVETRSRTEGRTVHEATVGGFPAEMPIVVLVNGQSASAAEIVAAALQDTKRARLVGTRTYGKGSVQTVYENRDESALKLTIGRYFTPSGQPVAPREGRQPEYVVMLPGGPDPADQLRERLTDSVGDEAARAELLGLLDDISPPHAREEGAVSWTGTVAERVERDSQLRTAVDLIEGRTP